MQHRREIDGLRAVAVVPVILFHSGHPWFSGGFVGVDVFFVISGYLITSLILEELSDGRFSIINFYRRRIQRIIPAMVFVLLVTSIAALWLMHSAQLEVYSRDLISTLLFYPNVHFWLKKTDYFSGLSEDMPLLHMWSLGVEEQYYLFAPVILIAIWRWNRAGLLFWMATFLLISFMVSEVGWRYQPQANFYLLLSRVWELSAGALCAYFLRHRSFGENDFLAALGFALIFVAVFAFDRSTPSPSVFILLPVVGTVMVILYATPSTVTGRSLALWPVMAVGLISYSAYLWHQPILAFSRIYLRETDIAHLALAVLVLSLVLAMISWRFVEQPFRKKNASAASVFIPFFVVMAMFVSGAVWLKEQRGLPWASAEELAGIDDWKAGQRPPGFGCMTEALSHPVENCLSEAGKSPDVILWGDSHAASVYSGLKTAADRSGLNLYASMAGGCPPVTGVAAVNGDYADCPMFNDAMLSYVERSGAKAVVLSAHWALYTEGSRFIGDEGVRDLGGEVPYDVISVSGDEGRVERLAQAYGEQVGRLLEKGLKVVLVYQIPIPGWDAPYRVLELKSAGDLGQIAGFDRTAYLRWAGRTNEMLDRIDGDGIFKLRPDQILCPDAQGSLCAFYNSGEILFFDSNHLSVDGAARLTGSFEQILESIFPAGAIQ